MMNLSPTEYEKPPIPLVKIDLVDETTLHVLCIFFSCVIMLILGQVRLCKSQGVPCSVRAP